jgi:8-oxo-dGTP pyrophosphatase MutT (NUDIX family)
MSYLDRIAECNRHDPMRYVPFVVDGEAVGAVRRDRLGALAHFDGLTVRPGEGVALAEGVAGAEARTAALAKVARVMCARGMCERWRGEAYPVGRRFGEVLFTIERAAAELFGVTAYGVHLTGTVRDGERLSLWVPRRSADRPTYPGKLDNTVAGGQPAGLSIADNLAKECAEEAGIPPEVARRARPVGTLSYRLDGNYGLKREVIFNFDLELPADFVPVNRDGEVGSFELWPVDKAMDVVGRTDDFKFNCALVLIDFFVRHGLIAPDHPDYVEICTGLRQ